MSKYDGGPAFPETGELGKAAGGEGMSLRDYFAAKALQAMLSNEHELQRLLIIHEGEVLPSIASSAYTIADAMLKERAK